MRNHRSTPVWRYSVLAALSLVGCAGAPPGVEPVQEFEPTRYLGTWYEIARLDHRFERGLSNVSATYTARADGGIDVLNVGYDAAKGAWREAQGKARFVGARDVGQLEVSFFGPFYGAYNVVDLDPEYSIALVAGPSTSYLWILARDRNPPRAEVERLVRRAAELGFDTGQLIYVIHDPNLPSAPAIAAREDRGGAGTPKEKSR